MVNTVESDFINGYNELLVFILVEVLNVEVEDTCGCLLGHGCCSLSFLVVLNRT